MSRAINLTMTEADVITKCRDLSIQISALEILPAGGVHLVCTTSEGAFTVRHKFKDKVITGKVKRSAFYQAGLSKPS